MILRRSYRNCEDENMEKSEKSYVLGNGLTLPWISFGTGVIWKYIRNKKLFIKLNLREALSSVKHLRLNRELKGNLLCKKYLNQAYDAGFRMFDTGRIYGYSEKYIGQTVAQKENVILVTKCSAMDVERDCSPNTVEGNLDLSLKNLGIDCVDIYLFHWPEGNWLEYYRQLIGLSAKGKFRAFGACNLKLEHLCEIERAKLPLPQIIQTEMHPFNAKIELREYCRDHGIQLMAHTPTAKGVKPDGETGGYLNALGKKYEKTAVQVVLRWHYQNDVIPVVSTFSRAHMEENLNIFDFALTEEEMKRIDELDKGMVLLKATGCYDDDSNYVYNY